MTKRSPWSSQHEPASPSGQDLPIHLKSARVPQLTETMRLRLLTHSSQTAAHQRCAIPPAISFPGKGSGFAAVGTSPSAHHGFIRGAIDLQSPESSIQHHSPVCGPTAVPCSCEYKQRHEENVRTDHAGTILSLPSSCRESRKHRLSLPHTQPCSFPQSCPTHPTPNFPAWSR